MVGGTQQDLIWVAGKQFEVGSCGHCMLAVCPARAAHILQQRCKTALQLTHWPLKVTFSAKLSLHLIAPPYIPVQRKEQKEEEKKTRTTASFVSIAAGYSHMAGFVSHHKR